LLGTSHAGIYGLAPHLCYGEKKPDLTTRKYIMSGGNFRWVALTTVPGALFGRRLIDARKTYRLDDARARDAISKHNFPTTEFRSVDLFADWPNALLRLQKPWSERPAN
jgi:hypothetical protein